MESGRMTPSRGSGWQNSTTNSSSASSSILDQADMSSLPATPPYSWGSTDWGMTRWRDAKSEPCRTYCWEKQRPLFLELLEMSMCKYQDKYLVTYPLCHFLFQKWLNYRKNTLEDTWLIYNVYSLYSDWEAILKYKSSRSVLMPNQWLCRN